MPRPVTKQKEIPDIRNEDKPIEGESYKDYMRRLSRNKDYSAYGVAGMAAASMLIKNGGGNEPVDLDKLTKLTQKIKKQPAFNIMVREEKDVGLMMANHAGSDLCVRIADTETKRQQEYGEYIRPADYDTRQADYEFLKTFGDRLAVVAGMDKEKPGSKAFKKKQDEMLKKYADVQLVGGKTTPASGTREEPEGEQPEPSHVRAMCRQARSRIDGPGRVPGKGGLGEEEFTLNMCLLQRYMPKEDFAKYCEDLNKHRPKDQPKYKPADFDQARFMGTKKPARDFTLRGASELDQHWKTKATIDVDALAEVIAIRRLSQANSKNVLSEADIQAEKDKLLTRGSAFHRAMQDVMSDPKKQEKLMGELKEPDNLLQIDNLVLETRAEMRSHALRTAQYQVNRSVRALRDGPDNSFLNTEHLANILAAREFAANYRLGTEPLDNGGFYDRANRIKNDPAFKRMANRYQRDAKYRAEIKKALASDDKADVLMKDYMEIQNKQRKQERLANGPEQQRVQQPPRRAQQQPQREPQNYAEYREQMLQKIHSGDRYNEVKYMANIMASYELEKKDKVPFDPNAIARREDSLVGRGAFVDMLDGEGQDFYRKDATLDDYEKAYEHVSLDKPLERAQKKPEPEKPREAEQQGPVLGL